MKLIPLILFLLMGKVLSAQTMECEIGGMSCESCARTAEKVINSVEGVDSVVVNFDTKTAKIYASGDIDTSSVKAVIKEETNFDIYFGESSKPKPLTDEERQRLDMELIRGGEKITFEDHLVEGKVTVFDFYAEWCGPCKVFSPKLQRLLLDYPDAALKKVDVVKWESPLAKQLTKEYKLPALPFILIFNENGKLLGKVEGNKIEEVQKILNKN